MSQPAQRRPPRRPIVLLADDLASQIAAGEVVERPASIVKELIENALDAGATRVTVKIIAGGIGSIEVADDGSGIHPEDAPLCLARHATSKLRAFSDLEELGTYGFRGEALPSIASVSHLEIVTRHHEQEAGLRVVAKGTNVPDLSPSGHPVGSTIRVLDLFFNVPARRKFLRSSNTESGHVGEVIVESALARPDVSFFFERDGRAVKGFERVRDRAQRAAQVLDDLNLFCVEGQRGPVNVQAFFSPIERARRGASGLKFLINERPIRDRALAATVAHAFGAGLERGRYPRGVVYLDLPRRLVDINVHPQKAEVRFVDGRAVADALYGVIARGVHTSERHSAPPPDSRSAPAVESKRVPIRRGEPAPPSGRRYDVSGSQLGRPVALGRPPRSGVGPSESRERVAEALFQASGAVERSGRLRLLGQAKDSYLVCMDGDGIVVLDQHAADEIGIFFRLEQAYRSGGLQSQALLFPATLALGRRQQNLVDRHGALLLRLGLDVRVRSDSRVSLHGTLGLLKRSRPESTLETFLSAAEACRDDAAIVERFLAEVACQEAVGRSTNLGMVDAQAIVRGLASVDPKLGHDGCVHGRPVLSVTTFAELARKAEW